MKTMKVSGPSIRKGNLVKAKHLSAGRHYRSIRGFYNLTVEEREAWYVEEKRAIKAGEITWHDSAGEGRLCPLQRYQDLDSNKVYPVLRARCRVIRSHRLVGGQVKILDAESGRELYCDREDLEVVG
jgi:hypothetical protein